MLPNFIIVGAMKAGTTTLRDFLTTMEQVWIYPGEIRFFSKEKYYSQGLSWYEKRFEAAAGRAAIGEKSPSYCYQPHVPERIQRCLPDVKLVWVFREPVARAYSHYWHAAHRGKERLNFRSAMERETERIRRNLLHGYAKRSRYAEQVERYLQFFPRDRMHFLLFEDLVRDPGTVLNGLLAFLGVDAVWERTAPLNHSNVTHAPRSVALQWLGRTMFGRGGAYRLISRVNVRNEPGYPPIPPDLRQRLAQEFLEPNEKLASLTGLDLSVWRKARGRR